MPAMPEPDHAHAAVVVAHPDDETLWAGGYILDHPEWDWRIVTLCRAADPDRAPRYHRCLDALGATGTMADLDDGPDQDPLDPALVQDTITNLLEPTRYGLILTHGPLGEYTRHRRHEECCRAVVALWQAGLLDAAKLMMFAFEDGGRAYLPRVRDDADTRHALTPETWRRKYAIMTELYGFAPDSWEARTTPREEGFWVCGSPQDAVTRLAKHKADP